LNIINGGIYISSNKPVYPGAANFLDKFKNEVAAELGIENYNKMDKGNLTSRANGYVGGMMVRKMIEFAEKNMTEEDMY